MSDAGDQQQFEDPIGSEPVAFRSGVLSVTG